MIKKVNREIPKPNQPQKEPQLDFFFGENGETQTSARRNAICVYDALIKSGLNEYTAKNMIEKLWQDAHRQGYKSCTYDMRCQLIEKELSAQHSIPS
jgi:hypothetical protein